MTDVLFDESDVCAVLSSFFYHTIEIPKNSRKSMFNIVAATNLDRQKMKKTIQDIRTYILHNENKVELDGTQTISKICYRVRLTF